VCLRDKFNTQHLSFECCHNRRRVRIVNLTGLSEANHAAQMAVVDSQNI